MIDSHCHPQFSKYDEDQDEVIRRALDAGVGMIAIGTDVETTRQGIALAEKYPNLWATAGLHPTDIGDNPGPLLRQGFGGRSVDNFVEFMSHNKVVGVGEVGLDYYRITNPEARIKQKEVFKSFIKLAQDFNKSLILHLRNSPDSFDAFSDALLILDEMFSGVACPPKFSKENLGVVHSFTGTLTFAQQFIERGFLIGLNGIITFSSQHDALIKAIPLEKILLETDAPFLAPVPHRGQRNEPLWVKYVAEKIAQVKNIPIDQVIKQTVENTVQLFKLSVE